MVKDETEACTAEMADAERAIRAQELTTAMFLAHLRRHPMPELMDEECAASLSAVERQYGDTITHGAGLEVRLGEEARYVDYIMNIDEHAIPSVPSLWYEIDYADYLNAARNGGIVCPCLFINTGDIQQDDLLDNVLPEFLGEARLGILRASLKSVIGKLPEGAYLRQIGTMTGRGELEIIRLVIRFPTWKSLFAGLRDVGWQGDSDQLREALEPWKDTQSIAVDLDLGQRGVLPKIGIEVSPRWRHPLLVDQFLSRLEEAGLCLPSKGEALRRWIRIRPDADPFIQTFIAYFKLNYGDGRITAAKAYLEQSPYIHHRYFEAYDRPVYVELNVKNETHTLPVDAALRWIRECRLNRVREVRFTGEAAEYGALDRLLAECAENGIKSTVTLTGEAPSEWLVRMIDAGAHRFLVDLGEETAQGPSLRTIRALRGLGFPNTGARWFLHGGNSGKLPQVIRAAEELGVRELIVTGMKPAARGIPLSKADLEATAETIRACQAERKGFSGAEPSSDMTLTVESCFSPLRAYLGGADPKKNRNRGIERGCTAGRDHFSVLPSGKVAPCDSIGLEEAYDTLREYWTHSPVLQRIRSQGKARETCEGCGYERRCNPCPLADYDTEPCPLQE